jgi:hypothetical protein
MSLEFADFGQNRKCLRAKIAQRGGSHDERASHLQYQSQKQKLFQWISGFLLPLIAASLLSASIKL